LYEILSVYTLWFWQSKDILKCSEFNISSSLKLITLSPWESWSYTLECFFYMVYVVERSFNVPLLKKESSILFQLSLKFFCLFQHVVREGQTVLTESDSDLFRKRQNWSEFSDANVGFRVWVVKLILILKHSNVYDQDSQGLKVTRKIHFNSTYDIKSIFVQHLAHTKTIGEIDFFCKIGAPIKYFIGMLLLSYQVGLQNWIWKLVFLHFIMRNRVMEKVGGCEISK